MSARSATRFSGSGTTCRGRSAASSKSRAARTRSSPSPRRASAARTGSAPHSPESTSSSAPGRSPSLMPFEPRGAGRAPVGRASPRRLRRASLLRLDVSASARRRAGDHDPRPRAAAPSRMDDRADAIDARAQVRETPPRPATWSSCNSAYTGRDVTTSLGVPAERIRVAHPAPKDVYRRGRAGGRPRRAVRPHGRDARAAEEPAGARRGSAPARWRPRARGRRRRGLGRAAAPRRTGHPSPRLRHGRRARASLPRRRRRRVSRPASRASGSRCSRRWRAGVPVVVSSHESLDEASGDAALRADPEDAAAFAAAIEQALADRERLVALGLEHARRFSWRAVGEIFLRGYEETRR